MKHGKHDTFSNGLATILRPYLLMLIEDSKTMDEHNLECYPRLVDEVKMKIASTIRTYISVILPKENIGIQTVYVQGRNECLKEIKQLLGIK